MLIYIINDNTIYQITIIKAYSSCYKNSLKKTYLKIIPSEKKEK